MKKIILLLIVVSGWNFSYGQVAGCPSPKLKQAELEAYQELIKARADAAAVLSGEISAIEEAKKKQQDKETLKYQNDLKTCGNDTACTGQKKIQYDDGVFIIVNFAKTQLAKAQDKEKATNEAAQKNYDEAVRKAKELYPSFCFDASGQAGSVTFTGTVCDTKVAFEITGTIPIGIVYPFKFIPTSETTGSFSFHTTYGSMVLQGNGTYKIKGINTQTPLIELQSSSSASFMGKTTTGSGPAEISLKCME